MQLRVSRPSWQDLVPACHIGGMATYTLISRPAGGYDIQIVGADGAHQTMVSFRTEADANVWITQDKRLAPMEDRVVGRLRVTPVA
jgi:hypothetical protein